MDWKTFMESQKITENRRGQLSLMIGCESCISWFQYRPGDKSYGSVPNGSCLSGYHDRDAAECPHYDLLVHCLNGIVYGKKRGCGEDCEACYREFEEKMTDSDYFLNLA